MESLKRRCSYQVTILDTLQNRVKNALQQTPLDEATLELLERQLTTKQSDLSTAYSNLVDEVTSEEEANALMQEQLKHDGNAFELLEAVGKALLQIRKCGKAGKATLTPTPTPVKLPTIELPTFSGKIEEWRSFWDQFEALVNSRADIAQVTKFNYLRGVLIESPLKLIQGFDTSENSYKQAVKLLKDTYDNPERAVRETTRKLLGLRKPAYRPEELVSFRADLESLLRILDNLNCNLDHSDWILTTIVSDKLPIQALESIQQRAGTDYPTLQQIREHLLQVINHITSVRSHNQTSCKNNDFVELVKPTTATKTGVIGGSKPVTNHFTSGSSSKQPKKGWSSTVTTCNSQDATGSKTNKTSSDKRKCLFCEEPHFSRDCHKFVTSKQRRDRLGVLGRCKQCCKRHDAAEECKLYDCPVCKEGKHHSYLCSKRQQEAATPVCTVNTKNETTALPVARLGVVRNRKTFYKRALLDSGSQKTFITRALVQELGLKPSGSVKLKVEGFLKEGESRSFNVVNLTVKLGRQYYRIQALETDRLPQNLTVHGLTKATQHLRQKLKLTDPDLVSDHINDLGLLIGMDQYFKIVKGQMKFEGINLIKTAGGCIIAGTLPGRFVPSNVQQNVAIIARVNTEPFESTTVETAEQLGKQIESLWELESLGIYDYPDTPEERYVEDSFKNTVKYCENKYWVRLPWKPVHPHLPDNFNLCMTRTRQTFEKLRKQTNMLDEFNSILSKQEQLDFIEKVDAPEVGRDNSHYLPQLSVVKESRTTPLRIVYDCSAKTKNGVSLNDCLYKGPSLVEELGKVMIKFRTNPWAYTSDISKAFLRIGLQEEDRDFTRFLWTSSQDKFEPSVTYRFKSVLFGSTSSPYLLQATLSYHLDTRHKENPCVEHIKNSLYVDNLQGTTVTETQLCTIYQEAQYIMKDASMPLQEWHTNSSALAAKVKLDYPEEQNQTEIKILGSLWNVQEDTIRVKETIWSPVRTKRELLSNCSKVYDPLGLLAPIIIQFRMLMQDVWRENVEWDEFLSAEILECWEICKNNALDISNVKFPRMTCKEGVLYNLHIFCDASPRAYGAVAYLVSEQETPTVVMAKARVAPLKNRTLPQLELTAIVIGCKLANYLKNTLTNILIEDIHVWTDSQVAMQWVISDKSDLVFVRNRVAEIYKVMPVLNLHHVVTKENPADCLTRVTNVSRLVKNNLWFNGPEWLSDKHYVTTTNCTVTRCTTQTVAEPLLKCEDYSSLNRLLRVTDKVVLAVNKLRPASQISINSLDYWIKVVQREQFPLEFRTLTSGSANRQPQDGETEPHSTQQTGLIKDLRLFMRDGIIRTFGRIERSELEYNTRHPILLPKKHHLTKLIIKQCHEAALHAGVTQTLSKLREEFWVPQGRQIIKNVIKTCGVCKRLEGPRYAVPPTPPLPIERVQTALPFQIVGVDYSGAIVLRKDTETRKVYVCLFTCAVTRAVHLELAEDLTAETFITVFRRFVARRSCPSVIISDNATNFKAGAEILAHLIQNLDVQQELDKYKIIWKFIPPRAPWHGGFYERMVGLVKGCLKKSLFRKQVSLAELQTLLAEIEARVNNRPLTYQTNSINDPVPLTPSHLLYGRVLNTCPLNPHYEEYLPEIPSHQQLNERHQYLDKILTFWNKTWRSEYLTSLRERYPKRGEATKSFSQNIKVGDVCLVHDTHSRENWPLGRIIEIYPDDRNEIRVVKLRTRLGDVVRSIKHLYPLEEEVESRNEAHYEPDLDMGDANAQPQPGAEAHTDADTNELSSEASTEQEDNFSLPTDEEINPPEPESHRAPVDLDLAVGRTRRRAADRCRAWLKGVCADEPEL